MARNLGVHAYVVKRAAAMVTMIVARVGAGGRRRVVIAALTGRYRSDDEPNQDDEPSDSHIYLRKTGSSCFAEEPRQTLSSTLVRPIHVARGTRCRKFGVSRHKHYPRDSFPGPVYRVC